MGVIADIYKVQNVLKNCVPKMREWQLQFPYEEKTLEADLKSRLQVMEKFIRFYNKEVNSVILDVKTEKCKISGRIFDHAEYPDDMINTTSMITTIKRIAAAVEGSPNDLFCAETSTGQKIYFYSDGYNDNMSSMIYDMGIRGGLNNEPGFYQSVPEFKRAYL